MKDILLTNSGDGTYDWNFTDNDLEIVNGVTGLRNQVIHAVLLKRDELDAGIYREKGSFLEDYVKMKNSERNKELLRNSLEATVNEIDGVYASKITVDIVDGQLLVADVTLIRDDGREVNIGAI
jgi:molybdopterin-binding protein